MRPLVSVIIPYYNRPIKVERCINSIISQSYKNVEIIVVDDCSPIPFKPSNENVITIRNTTNLGPGLSRNKGKELAQGDFIAFLDSDDYWHRDFLETCLLSIELNPLLAMVYCDGQQIDEVNEVVVKRRAKSKPPKTILPDILYKGRYWGTGGCLWRMDVIKSINFIDSRTWEDYAFDVAVAIYNNSILHINKSLVYFDISGELKLSNQLEDISIKEKCKSIQFISKILLDSSFRNDTIIQKSITILMLLNMVKLLSLNVFKYTYFKKYVNLLILWQNLRFGLYVFTLCLLPKRITINYLKLLKRAVNQDKLNYMIT